MRLIFDIEADNLLDDVTQVWCIVTRDVDTDEVHTFDPNNIEEGIKLLDKADMLIGHNIIEYDLRVLEKLHGYKYTGQTLDTLVYSRTIWPDIREVDIKLHKQDRMPLALIGRQSLKAWGYRLGELKGVFGSDSEDFGTFSQEMLDYCVQDTLVNHKLYLKIMDSFVEELIHTIVYFF